MKILIMPSACYEKEYCKRVKGSNVMTEKIRRSLEKLHEKNKRFCERIEQKIKEEDTEWNT